MAGQPEDARAAVSCVLGGVGASGLCAAAQTVVAWVGAVREPFVAGAVLVAAGFSAVAVSPARQTVLPSAVAWPRRVAARVHLA